MIDETYNMRVIMNKDIERLYREIDTLKLIIETIHNDIAQIKYQMKRDNEPDLRYML